LDLNRHCSAWYCDLICFEMGLFVLAFSNASDRVRVCACPHWQIIRVKVSAHEKVTDAFNCGTVNRFRMDVYEGLYFSPETQLNYGFRRNERKNGNE
jgi:hypothetical protein